MSFRPVIPDFRRRCSGVALVIVLAFVVLLTGLIIAFFSRALSDRQISDSSANETRVDVFAAGAVNTVLGDFRQEIAAGSTQVATSPAVAGLTIFNPTGAAAAPCLAGTALGDGLPNLVKRSAYQQPFYSGSVYNVNVYPASNRAANSSTTTAAQNGRAVSPARWNKALLLPKKSPASETDLTPVNSQNTYTPPDWIVVARDGTNPSTWSTALAVNGATPAVGRFAYNVYNEGGLLDANVAGYPTSTATGVPTSNFPACLPAYKASLAFADLKQLPGINSLSNTRQEQVVRTLLGWRNYATTGIDPTQAVLTAGTPVSGSVNTLPGYIWTDPTTLPPGINVFNFLNFAQINGNGFLRTSNPLTVNGQSDRFFSSRQQLLALLLQSVADQSANGSTERAYLQNAMQCLGTFSRSLNQPSYVPPAGRPTVQALNSGGNYEGPIQGQDNINPPFLAMRVAAPKAGGRNDLTDMIVGDPLVKKRFPLSRLAWLTYKGPSQGRTGADIDDLKTNFGYTQAFLDQGTAANIQRNFGLTWDSRGFWSYNVKVGQTGIMTLKEVQADNHEPNFIELLKAAITAGALGKYGTQSSTGPTGAQFLRDSSIDCQVIQIAANIIDQFDVDGYPTRIQFPAYSREFRGVENLPYFYRVRNGIYRLDNPNLPNGSDSNQDWFNTTVSRQGTFIMVEQPEIWNPHAYDGTNAATTNRSLGYPRPQNLQLVVYGAGPQLPPNKPDTGVTIGFNNVRCWWEEKEEGGVSGPSSTRLNETYTLMRFSNGASLYREPTLLIKPGLPSQSNLQAPGFLAAMSADGLGAYAAVGGAQVLDSAAMVYGTSEPVGGVYLGIYLGKNVVGYPGTGSNNSNPPNAPGTRVAGQTRISGGPTWLTYQIQCDSATGTGTDVYDEKYFGVDSYSDDIHVFGSVFGMLSTSAAGQNSYSGRHIVGLNRMMTFMDPRTSRFGVVGSITGDNVNYQSREFAAPGLKSVPTPRWVDQANNVVSSNRPDNSAGFGMTGGPSGAGWTWNNTLFRFGLFSQNNPAISNDDRRFSGDPDGNNMGVASAQYYADADGVVRRAAGAYVKAGTAPTLSGSTTTGLPMATAYYSPVESRQKESRPIILNRPFRSVGELGAVFSDVPWKNIDFSISESGYAPLLDVFCVNDTDDPTGLVAGKVDLNTRQLPVLQAILSGAYKDENNGASQPLSATDALTLAGRLVTRTTTTAPLASLADVVGGWKPGTGYAGFADVLDLGTDLYNNNIPRYRESAVRALSAAGNTRVWSLMIDLVAQTGRYPQSASGLDKFVVEGEQRYWVHVAIDRYTGQVIDKQIEVVKE